MAKGHYKIHLITLEWSLSFPNIALQVLMYADEDLKTRTGKAFMKGVYIRYVCFLGNIEAEMVRRQDEGHSKYAQIAKCFERETLEQDYPTTSVR